MDQYYAQEYIASGGKDRRFTKFTYNLNPKAKGNGGMKWPAKSVEKLKLKFKIQGHTCLGRVCSEETREKMRTTHKTRRVSVGSRNPNFGVKGTREKRNKVIATWLKNGRLKPFVAIDNTGKEYGPFNTSTECVTTLGVWKCQVKKCLSGKPKYKSAKGYTFKFLENA